MMMMRRKKKKKKKVVTHTSILTPSSEGTLKKNVDLDLPVLKNPLRFLTHTLVTSFAQPDN